MMLHERGRFALALRSCCQARRISVLGRAGDRVVSSLLLVMCDAAEEAAAGVHALRARRRASGA